MGLLRAWSYSRWKDYDQCGAKARYKYVDKIPEPESPALERGSDVHKTVAQYLRGDLPTNDPIPGWTYFAELFRALRDLDPLVEQQWGFDRKWNATGWFGSDVWFRSVLDAGKVYEDDFSADVVDFKTGKPRPTDTSAQAELYAVSVFQRYPMVRTVAVRFWYLDVIDIPDNQRETVYRFSRDMAPKIIERWTKRAARMLNDKIMAPTPGTHCKWCSFAKSAGGPCKYG